MIFKFFEKRVFFLNFYFMNVNFMFNFCICNLSICFLLFFFCKNKIFICIGLIWREIVISKLVKINLFFIIKLDICILKFDYFLF